MGLFAKRILRDPCRTLELDQLFSKAVKKEADASQTSNRDKQSRIPDTKSTRTKKGRVVEYISDSSVDEEHLPVCLRSFLPERKGGYWNNSDVHSKRKRKSTTRLFESVDDDIIEKVLAEEDNEPEPALAEEDNVPKPAFRIPKKQRFSNPPNEPRETSFVMMNKKPALMTSPTIVSKSNAEKKKKKKPVSLFGPNKPSAKRFQATTPPRRLNHQDAFPDRSPSSSPSFLKPRSIEWKTSSLPMEERKKKKEKKIPKRMVKLEEEIANNKLADIFRYSVQAAEDFMNTEQE